ncbi:NeuD/PglB/VioB family sugar acetyltransferase [Aquimarina celericrescens]|uniref:NeuD/PglB/VioB family sugar acetyltransferase n=1 Tax=Aquimarina celericrescens TaxID=1964542 RepID=A0ABW5AT92_9FLAO|nr:NeuD/PglB/VioB family sugar acetyltransferase [Aquimarina celericrescens]
MKLRNLVIVGAGTYGETLLTYLTEAGHKVLGFVDDIPKLKGQKINGVSILGNYKDLFKDEYKRKIDHVICSIGNNKIRNAYLSELSVAGYNTPNFIHDSVLLTKDTILGKGVYILPGSVLMPHVVIHDFCIISTGCKVAHHTILHQGVFISSGANVGAGIKVFENTLVGIGSTLMTGVKTIGKNSIIGAGAAVITDVPENAVVVGVPAKVIKYSTPMEEVYIK